MLAPEPGCSGSCLAVSGCARLPGCTWLFKALFNSCWRWQFFVLVIRFKAAGGGTGRWPRWSKPLCPGLGCRRREGLAVLGGKMREVEPGVNHDKIITTSQNAKGCERIDSIFRICPNVKCQARFTGLVGRYALALLTSDLSHLRQVYPPSWARASETRCERGQCQHQRKLPSTQLLQFGFADRQSGFTPESYHRIAKYGLERLGRGFFFGHDNCLVHTLVCHR